MPEPFSRFVSQLKFTRQQRAALGAWVLVTVATMATANVDEYLMWAGQALVSLAVTVATGGVA